MGPTQTKNLEEVMLEFADLKARLEEAESTIDAIRSGAVDALIVKGQKGDQVYTLHGADEPYRVFVEHMNEGAVTLDRFGTILYSNRAFADMVAEPLECVIGTEFQLHLPPASRFDAEEICRTDNGRVETILISNGREVPVLASVTRITIDGPAALAVTITDLTPQKEHESELKRAVAELEGFCYSVSHDLRAPLRSMISAASIVIEDFGDYLPPLGKKELNRIATSASYWGRLIDDLLAYSRLQRDEVRASAVDLTSLAQQVSASFESQDHPNIEWEIEPDLVAEGDARLLGMAFHNLFSNAVKFSSQSNPAKIRFGRDAESGAFFVQDNGIGFDMQYVLKLFLPFERLHRQEDYPGTGIGLANVKRVILRHGGNIWAEAIPGKGATFFFTLCPDTPRPEVGYPTLPLGDSTR
jgi:PAS domain S-box-containing protein